MRSDLTLFCLAAAAVFYLSAPVLAQDAPIQAPSHPAHPGNAAKVQELQRLIEEQQRQLNAQQEQLEAQKRRLHELRQQVQGLAYLDTQLRKLRNNILYSCYTFGSWGNYTCPVAFV